jgi:hypothetical protein
MTGRAHFIAVLLHLGESSRDRAVYVPLMQATPPEVLEVITEFDGLAAFDVYELVDHSEWPAQAVFWYKETVPQTSEEVGRNVKMS